MVSPLSSSSFFEQGKENNFFSRRVSVCVRDDEEKRGKKGSRFRKMDSTLDDRHGVDQRETSSAHAHGRVSHQGSRALMERQKRNGAF